MNDADLDLLATKVMGWKRRSASWEPHKSIAQAFEVEAVMAKRGWLLRLARSAVTDKPWIARLVPNDKRRCDWFADGITPAEAICRAALEVCKLKAIEPGREGGE